MSTDPSADAPAGSAGTGSSTQLSTEDRAAAFSSGRSPVDRNAALRAGRDRVPRRVVLRMTAALAVIGLGGIVVEHFFGNWGVPSASVTTTTLSTNGAPLPSTPAPPTGPALGASLNAFLGLKQIGDATAPDLTMREQSGALWTLSAQAGKVVVLTFYSKACTDICPVLGAELRQADQLLGSHSTDVEFAVVNTDPTDTTVSAGPDSLTIPGLATAANVHFLTTDLRALNTTWIDYGVQVTVGNGPSQVTHNNIMYFVDPRGRLRALAIPFANENRRGDNLLPPADTHRFAVGIARTATSLVGAP